MAHQFFKWLYLIFGFIVVLLAFCSLSLFISGVESDENLLNGLIIFSPVILSGILVVVSSLLLFWDEAEKIQKAFFLNKTNVWLVSIVFLVILLASLISFFASRTLFKQLQVVTIISLFLYPVLIAFLAFGDSRFKTLSDKTSKPQTTVGKITSILLILVIILVLFLLMNLLFPSLLFGEAVGMGGWVVILGLGTLLFLLAPVLIILSAIHLRQNEKN